MKATLRKVSWNKGKLDNGTEYNYTRLFIEVPVYYASENEFGYDVMQCDYGDESRHQELINLRGKLPVEVEVDIYQAKKGGQIIHVVDSLKVLNQSAPAKSS